MGTLMAYGPDVVGLPGGPPHGLVELWVNPSPTAAFAAQTLTFSNKGYSIDAVMIETGTTSTVNNLIMVEVGGTGSLETFGLTGTSKMVDHARGITVSTNGTDISVVFTDNTVWTQNAIGTAPSSATNNSGNVPKRILGLIHED